MHQQDHNDDNHDDDDDDDGANIVLHARQKEATEAAAVAAWHAL